MDEKVADLLERWEELADQGQELSVEELCQDKPELVEELRWRIAALKKTSWVKQPLSEIESTAPKDHGLPTHLGRYRLDELIGSGGFGQVWRGFDPELHRVVALKIPRPEQLSSSDDFSAEARRVAGLRHPAIVTVHDVGQEGKVCYIVTDFLEGGSLADNGQLEEQRAVEIVIQIADALGYAHAQGFVHRDIKPANILLDQDGTPHVADFGIATTVDEANQQTAGTLAYMSPEQASGGDVDTRSDIYSLGVVLHELLTGLLPYEAKEHSELRRSVVGTNVGIGDIPKPLTRILQNCLAKDRDQRYQSAAALAADLRLYLDSKGRRGGSIWVVGLSLVLAIGAIVVWSQWDSPSGTLGLSSPPQIQPEIQPSPHQIANWEAHEGGVNDVVVRDDGTIISAGNDNKVRVWDSEGQQKKQIDLPATVNSIATTKNKIACGCDNGIIQIWMMNEDKPTLVHSLSQHTASITGMTFSPDGDYLFAGAEDGKFISWNLTTDPPKAVVWPDTEGIPSTVTFLGDDLLAVGIGNQKDQDGRFWLWRMREVDGEKKFDPVLTPILTGVKNVTAVGFLEDGPTILAATHPDGITIWRVTEDKKSLEAAGLFQGHTGKVTAIAPSPDGKLVASADEDGWVRIWNPSTLKEFRRLQGHVGPVADMSWSHDGRTVVSGGADGTIRVWTVKNEDRVVAEWVLSMEGTVQTDKFRKIVETEEDLPNDDFTLIAVGFNVNRRLKDEDLARLSKLKHLERVILNACPITDEGLAHLRGMTTLEHLGLFGTEVTNEGLDHLAGLTELRWLSLSGTNIGDGAIEKLLPLTKLKNLQIGNVPLTDDGIKRLPELVSLEIVSLDKTEITDEGLLRLAELPYLYRLRVGKTGVTEEGVMEFRRRKPRCEVAWGR